jgi:hypothetical protein
METQTLVDFLGTRVGMEEFENIEDLGLANLLSKAGALDDHMVVASSCSRLVWSIAAVVFETVLVEDAVRHGVIAFPSFWTFPVLCHPERDRTDVAFSLLQETGTNDGCNPCLCLFLVSRVLHVRSCLSRCGVVVTSDDADCGYVGQSLCCQGTWRSGGRRSGLYCDAQEKYVCLSGIVDV